MRIGSGQEYLDLDVLEIVPGHLPTPGDVRVKASVEVEGFCGTYDGV
ncbi:MAG: hypothetical protein AAF196_18150 [Planctomycetota bacterium]